jgi:hypothetical protein
MMPRPINLCVLLASACAWICPRTTESSEINQNRNVSLTNFAPSPHDFPRKPPTNLMANHDNPTKT